MLKTSWIESLSGRWFVAFLLLVGSVLAPSLLGQTGTTLLFSPDQPQKIITWTGGSSFAHLDCQEVGVAGPGMSTTRLLSLQTMHAFQGDPANLGDYTSPFLVGAVDALFEPLAEQKSPAQPRLPFISVARRTMPLFLGGKPVNLSHAALFRWRPGGTVEVFLTRAHLQTATGIQSSSLDLDAFCQDGKGNIFFSLALDEPATAPVIKDGDLCYIAATDITRDGQGMVIGVKPGSAMVAVSESALDGRVAASGLADSGGKAITVLGNLSALTIDPAGGTFPVPGKPGLSMANLLFAGSGAAWAMGACSTSGGGSIGKVGNLLLGSLVKTNGAHLELGDPGGGVSTSGLGGLALCSPPAAEIMLCEEQGGRFLKSTGKVTFSFAGAEPTRQVLVLVAPGPTGPGQFLPSYPMQVPLSGNRELYFAPPYLLLFSLGQADGTGCGKTSFPLPGGFAGPLMLTAQALGPVKGGSLSLSPPILMQWF